MRQPVPFGKYLLLDRISVGGMAEVFKAKSYGVEGFEKIIAIKRILPTMGEDRDFIKMFIDEAKIAGQLAHANICQIFELGRIDGSHFIAMEYIWGKDLLQIQNRLRKVKQPMPVQMACFAIAKVLEGLDYAHRKRDPLGRPLEIVHRDCSPQNVLVSYEGEVKVIDFGIAKATSRNSRTMAGVLKGKFGYMSPEQVRGLPLDRRSDIFALGTMLYECLTSDRLFQGETDFSTLEKVRNVDIQPPRSINPDIPEEVERVIMKALAKDVDDRYQWCSEMLADLQQYLMAQEVVFTAKGLSSWVKELFLAEIDRERQLLEQYKRVGRDGLIGGVPSVEADRDVVSNLGEAGPAEGDPTTLGGPSFDDIEAELAGMAGSHEAGPASGSPAAIGEELSNDFGEEAPTEIFGEIDEKPLPAAGAPPGPPARPPTSGHPASRPPKPPPGRPSREQPIAIAAQMSANGSAPMSRPPTNGMPMQQPDPYGYAPQPGMQPQQGYPAPYANAPSAQQPWPGYANQPPMSQPPMGQPLPGMPPMSTPMSQQMPAQQMSGLAPQGNMVPSRTLLGAAPPSGFGPNPSFEQPRPGSGTNPPPFYPQQGMQHPSQPNMLGYPPNPSGQYPSQQMPQQQMPPGMYPPPGQGYPQQIQPMYPPSGAFQAVASEPMAPVEGTRKRSTLLRDVLIGVAIAALVLTTFLVVKFVFLNKDDSDAETSSTTMGNVVVNMPAGIKAELFVDGKHKAALNNETGKIPMLAGSHKLKVVATKGEGSCEGDITVPSGDTPASFECKLVADTTAPPAGSDDKKPDDAKPVDTKPDPSKTEPVKTDTKTEPAKPDAAKVDPAKTDPAKPDTKVEPAKPDKTAVKADPGTTPPTKADPAKTDAKTDTVKTVAKSDPKMDTKTDVKTDTRKVDPSRHDKMPSEDKGSSPADSTKGFLQIYSKPTAKILVDGVDTGMSTPISGKSLALTPGKHKITFVIGDDRFTYSQTIKAGSTDTMSKDLQ